MNAESDMKLNTLVRYHISESVKRYPWGILLECNSKLRQSYGNSIRERPQVIEYKHFLIEFLWT